MAFEYGAFFLVVGLFALHLIIPGPNMLYLSAAYGRGGQRACVSFALGTSLGTAIWAAAAFFGVLHVLQSDNPYVNAVVVALGMGLILIGARSISDGLRASVTLASGAGHAVRARSFVSGLFVTLTNVNEIVFWAAMTAIVSGADMSIEARLALVAITAVLAIGFDIALVLAVRGNGIGRFLISIRRALELVNGVAFCATGLAIVVVGQSWA